MKTVGTNDVNILRTWPRGERILDQPGWISHGPPLGRRSSSRDRANLILVQLFVASIRPDAPFPCTRMPFLIVLGVGYERLGLREAAGGDGRERVGDVGHAPACRRVHADRRCQSDGTRASFSVVVYKRRTRSGQARGPKRGAGSGHRKYSWSASRSAPSSIVPGLGQTSRKRFAIPPRPTTPHRTLYAGMIGPELEM